MLYFVHWFILKFHHLNMQLLSCILIFDKILKFMAQDDFIYRILG